MRAPRAVAVAVREAEGGILVKADPFVPFFQRYRLFRLPFVRGAFVMIDSLIVGMRALSWSAEQSTEPEEAEGDPNGDSADEAAEDSISGNDLDPEDRDPTGPETTGPEPPPRSPESTVSRLDPTAGSELSRKERLALTSTLVLSVVFGLGLFVALPHLVTDGLGWLAGTPLDVDGMAFHLVDGVVKLIIFLAYLALIRRHPEILRVFAYHGAEHKTIYAWEQGLELDVGNVRAQSRFHPRCGTSFIIFVVCFSILVFSAIFALLPPLPVENRLARNLLQVAIKIPLTLPIAALSYEFIRFTSRKWHFSVCRALARPGLLLQRLTTEEPTDDQLEVAIAALEAAFEVHARQEGADLGLEGAVYRTGSAVIPSGDRLPEGATRTSAPS